MSETRYTIGVDFGTKSGRAVLVDVSNGDVIASAVHLYENGVIDDVLPGTGVRLDPDWALQDPDDYLAVLMRTVPAVLDESGVDAAHVIGVGIDFTACTILPTKGDGTPLCAMEAWRDRPHAWVKLWKHHAAQPEANKLNQIARKRGEPWLDRYGGKISSEWFFPKVWQMLNEDPEVYEAADRLIEAADWVVWQLTGSETRNNCTAGYKAIWSQEDGFPSQAFLSALDPRLETVVDGKMMQEIQFLGDRAGGVSEEAARWTGLQPGTSVAVANVDAHVSVPAATVTQPGRMVIIMGTSNCHMVLSERERAVPGICGYVEDGIIPGFFGYEAGQSCVGDHFAWFVENCVPAHYASEAEARGLSLHELLEAKAATQQPGEHGLVALDWWNGNRSVLVDADLTGLLIGQTLATKPEDIYRALIEATAYGTRLIVETFEQHGIPVREIVATGGLPDRNELLMQIYADVTGCEVKIAAAEQTPALGSAMFGAVAAGKENGGYDSIAKASAGMSDLRDKYYAPIPAHTEVYNQLYAEYVGLHDCFGRGINDVMKRLKAIRAEAFKEDKNA